MHHTAKLKRYEAFKIFILSEFKLSPFCMCQDQACSWPKIFNCITKTFDKSVTVSKRPFQLHKEGEGDFHLKLLQFDLI